MNYHLILGMLPEELLHWNDPWLLPTASIIPLWEYNNMRDSRLTDLIKDNNSAFLPIFCKNPVTKETHTGSEAAQFNWCLKAKLYYEALNFCSRKRISCIIWSLSFSFFRWTAFSCFIIPSSMHLQTT